MSGFEEKCANMDLIHCLHHSIAAEAIAMVAAAAAGGRGNGPQVAAGIRAGSVAMAAGSREAVMVAVAAAAVAVAMGGAPAGLLLQLSGSHASLMAPEGLHGAEASGSQLKLWLLVAVGQQQRAGACQHLALHLLVQGVLQEGQLGKGGCRILLGCRAAAR